MSVPPHQGPQCQLMVVYDGCQRRFDLPDQSRGGDDHHRGDRAADSRGRDRTGRLVKGTDDRGGGGRDRDLDGSGHDWNG